MRSRLLIWFVFFAGLKFNADGDFWFAVLCGIVFVLSMICIGAEHVAKWNLHDR